MTTPKELVEQLRQQFAPTGIKLLNIDKINAFLQSENKKESFETWSVYYQRLFRYHDFCALELSDVVAEGGKAVVHLMVENKLHEALSGTYRLIGSAIDAMDPEKEQPLAHPQVLKDEIDAINSCLLILFWAFATKSERGKFCNDHFQGTQSLPEDLAKLISASPEEVIFPDGEFAYALEDLAEAAQLRSDWFGRTIYPPLHPAVEYHSIATDEQLKIFRS